MTAPKHAPPMKPLHLPGSPFSTRETSSRRCTSVMSGLLLCLSGSALASEVVRRDVLLAVSTAPTAFDYTLSSPGGGFSGSDTFSYALAPRLGVRWGLVQPGWNIAPVVGADLFYRQAAYAGGGSMTGRGAALTLGAAWAINDSWSSDVEFAASYEQASLQLGGGSGLNGTSLMHGYDLRLRTLRSLDRTWSAGIEAGWQQSQGNFSASSDRSLELKSSGWTAAVVVVWRLSARPAGLE